MYKHFVDNPHKPLAGTFFTWVRAHDVLGSVSKATISMSNPDFLIIAKLVKKMQSCGTSIDVMVDHTIQGVVMPFKFTNLFLGETRYIGKVERSDESQSVGRVVMDVSKLEEEINHGQYDDPPVEEFHMNPVLAVSLVNITPIVPLYVNGISYGRRQFFLDSPMQFKKIVTLRNRSGRSISPSRFKFELGKDFQTYFEYIPGGYERLLPESVEEARALASEIKDVSESIDLVGVELESSADSVLLRYGFGHLERGRRYTYDVKVFYWPVVSIETTLVFNRPLGRKSPRV